MVQVKRAKKGKTTETNLIFSTVFGKVTVHVFFRNILSPISVEAGYLSHFTTSKGARSKSFSAVFEKS